MDLVKWGKENVVDGALKLADNKQNRKLARDYLRYLITKADVRLDGGRLAIPKDLSHIHN